MAKIQLNGRNISIQGKQSIFNLLKKYKINNKKVAVEVNGKIINKNRYKLSYIKNNDKIEIVHFIGGG
jgi:sulfur carrier protein|tara:strand:- start:220 stop:423 length:204 start_codon:yes stop_codon:yes gene_type:complete